MFNKIAGPAMFLFVCFYVLDVFSFLGLLLLYLMFLLLYVIVWCAFVASQ